MQESITKRKRKPYHAHGLKSEHHLIKEGRRGISIRQFQSVPYYAATGYGGTTKSRCIELNRQRGTAER